MKLNFKVAFAWAALAATALSGNAQEVIYDGGTNGYIAGSVITLNVPAKGTLSIVGEGCNSTVDDINSGKGGLYTSYTDGVLDGLIDPSSTRNESDMFGSNVFWFYRDVEPATYYFSIDEDIFWGFTVTLTEGENEVEDQEMRIIVNQIVEESAVLSFTIPYDGTLTVIVDGMKKEYPDVNNGNGCIYASLSGGIPADQLAPTGDPDQTGNALFGYNATWIYEEVTAGTYYFFCNVQTDHLTIKITGVPNGEEEDPEGPTYTNLNAKILTPAGETSLEMLQLTWQGATLSFNEGERPTGTLVGPDDVEYVCNFAINENTSILDVTFRDAENGTAAEIKTPGEYTLTIEAGGVLVNGLPNRAVSLTYEVEKDENLGVEAIEASNARADIYSLQGVRLQGTDVKALPKGLYIVNGKKVVIR